MAESLRCDYDSGAACPSDCAWLFDRVRVFPVIRGGTQVEWVLHPQFVSSTPGPYVFQLQAAPHGVVDADNWVNVGSPATDTYYLVDAEQRVFGTTQWTHYRIALTAGATTYYSAPVSCLGSLSPRDWQIARGIIRAETMMLRRRTGQQGYILKRKLPEFASDETSLSPENVCSCMDLLTDDVRNPQCELCHGTGVVGGYYPAFSCAWAALDNRVTREQLDDSGTRGTVNDIVVSARMLAFPQLLSRDVWVDRGTDIRYFVGAISSLVELRGFPIVSRVELRPAPFSDPVYGVSLEDDPSA